MEALIQKLNVTCDEQGFRTRWYLKNLLTGEEAGRDEDLVVYSASTRKIAIMMAYMCEVHSGRMSLNDPFIIEEKYQNNQSGCFQHLKPGFQITLSDALTMAIIVSDNACTGKLVDMIGFDRLNEFSASVGMTRTTHRQNIPDPNLEPERYPELSNATSAHDVGHLLNQMIAGSNDTTSAGKLGSSPELCQLGIEIMSWQKLGKLSQMLPLNTRVASKTGRGPAHHSDAGIIFKGDEPLFILTAYTEGVPVNYQNGPSGKYVATTHIANLSRICWDALA